MWDKQRLDIYSNQIISRYESVRNNSLIWRGIWNWTDIDKINEWQLEFSLQNSWSLTARYSTGWAFINSDEYSLLADTQKLYSIKSMKCLKLDKTENQTLSWSDIWRIILNWDNISLSWCTDLSSKILELGLFYKWHEKTLKINTINWLIEEE